MAQTVALNAWWFYYNRVQVGPAENISFMVIYINSVQYKKWNVKQQDAHNSKGTQ